MRDTKYRVELFQLYDFSGMEKHLERMAEQGWMLEETGTTFWRYRRIGPQKLKFAVTYYEDASGFEPQPTEGQEMLYDFCEMSGWNFVTGWNQMQIFCSADDNAPPLETDSRAKLDNIRRTMKKSGIGGNVTSLLAIGIYLVYFIWETSLIHLLSSSFAGLALGMYLLFIIYTLSNLAFYGLWLYRAKKAVRQGDDLPRMGGGYRMMGRGILAIGTILGLVWLICYGKRMYYYILAAVLIGGIANDLISEAVRRRMKRKGVKRDAAKAAVLFTRWVVTVLVLLTLTFSIIYEAIPGMQYEGLPPEEVVVTAENGSERTWEVYNDNLPLTVEELGLAEDALYSKQKVREERSPFAHYVCFRQEERSANRQNRTELSYTIHDTKLMYDDYVDAVMEGWLKIGKHKLRSHEFRPVPTAMKALWKADRVEQLYVSDEARQVYVICWREATAGKDRIVELDFSWTPTMDQMKLAGEKLLEVEL